ncbi:MAG TPA: DUF554 domain-containing protein [Candidatus Limnocylindrales bacterium]|jgi:uncharacterized membrane protein YqgA involved in biofilm formation
MFLTGTLLNTVAIVLGTTVGLLAASRMPPRIQGSLMTGIGFFVTILAVSMGLRIFEDPASRVGDSLAVLAGLLVGVVTGELLGIHDRLEALGAWFQRRLARGEEPSRIAEAFVSASLVFCVGPLTILGSLDNGLRGDATLLATKSLLDGLASVAFAAALGPGVYLAAITVLVIQGAIAATAFLLRDVLDARTVLAMTAVGGMIILGIALRLLDLKAVRVANFLPGLIFAPLFIHLADWIRAAVP